jgi:hypothetical protein
MKRLALFVVDFFGVLLAVLLGIGAVLVGFVVLITLGAISRYLMGPHP